MKRSWLVRLLGIGVLTVALTKPAFAFLGFGDIVFDPSVFAQTVQQLIRMEQQYLQLVQTYQVVRSQHEQALRMARRVPVNMSARYRAISTAWRPSQAANTYGTTGLWTDGINRGQNAEAGYRRATQALEGYGSAFANIPGDQQERVTSYGTVELTDGANIAAMETIGRLRGAAPAVQTAIQGLEDDSLSSDADMNSEIAVLNKINAASLISIHTGQDTNQLLIAMAEQQIVDAKRKRDAEAQAINNHIRFMSQGKAVMAAQAKDASAAMRAWRMP